MRNHSSRSNCELHSALDTCVQIYAFHRYENARVIAFIRGRVFSMKLLGTRFKRVRVDFLLKRELQSCTGDFNKLHFYCFTRGRVALSTASLSSASILVADNRGGDGVFTRVI